MQKWSMPFVDVMTASLDAYAQYNDTMAHYATPSPPPPMPDVIYSTLFVSVVSVVVRVFDS
jgi:hypothetical protein